MAVFVAIFALLLLPSVFADQSPDVSTVIGSGTLSLTGSGDYGSGSLALSGVAVPPINDVSATFFASATNNDYLVLTDSTSTDGAHVRVKLSSADSGGFSYTGSSIQQGPIPVNNLKLIANISNGSYAAASKSVTNDTDYTFAISATHTASSAEADLGLYTLNSAFTSAPYYMAMSAVNQDYLVSTASSPLKGIIRLDKLVLDIPGGSNPGDYASTLVITVSDG